MRITLHFPIIVVDLLDSHKTALAELVRNMPAKALVSVAAHACATPVVTALSLDKYKDNFGFSAARLKSVTDELIRLGVSDITGTPLGSTLPISPSARPDENRRVEITVEPVF